MLDFKNGIQFLGLLLILATCVICLNFACQEHKKEIITETKIKTDTLIKYVNVSGKAQRVVNNIIRINDTVNLTDTFIIYRDKNINLEVNNINSDTPTINYQIKEVTVVDSVFIPAPKPKNISLGISGNQYSICPVVGYSTNQCNYFIGYDVKNKVPSFGLLVNLTNIAKPSH